MQNRIVIDKEAVIRHRPTEIIEHWLLALSGLFLIFSGFGELPMYKRYMVTQIPGLGWAGDFFINLKIHYLAGIVFVSVMIFHALYHGWLGHRGLVPRRGDLKASVITLLSIFGFGEEPKSHKYLPEQRLAYTYLGAVGLILVLTGLVKVIKNLPGVSISPVWITSITLIHTFATIFFLLGVLAHLAALIFKVNRPLVKSIFTGRVDLGYVQDRHTIWYDELRETNPIEKEKARVEVAADAGHEEGPKPPMCEGGNEIQARKEENTMASTIKVKGMSCQHCVMSVKKALSQLEGIQNVEVDLQKGEVRFDTTKQVTSDTIEKAILDAGYQVVQC